MGEEEEEEKRTPSHLLWLGRRTLLGINAAPQQFPPRYVTPRQPRQSNEAAKFIVMIVNYTQFL